jgi:hypothetical protein
MPTALPPISTMNLPSPTRSTHPDLLNQMREGETSPTPVSIALAAASVIMVEQPAASPTDSRKSTDLTHDRSDRAANR